MKEVDQNGDGKISFEEFKWMMHCFRDSTIALKSWSLP